MFACARIHVMRFPRWRENGVLAAAAAVICVLAGVLLFEANVALAVSCVRNNFVIKVTAGCVYMYKRRVCAGRRAAGQWCESDIIYSRSICVI